MRNAAIARMSLPHPRSAGAGATGTVMLALGAADVRDQRQIARPLDRRGELALMPRARAAQAAGKNLPVIGDETAQRPVVLVVDEPHAAFAERTGLVLAAHGLILVVVVVMPAGRGGNLFLAHRRGARVVLVQRQQVAHHAVVQPERALVLGKHHGIGAEPRDHVVPGVLAADLVRELTSAPMIGD